MVDLKEILERYSLEVSADRIGPDHPFTHWRLYFRRLATALCKDKFRNFGDGAEFRPGAYAIGCSNIEIGDRVVIRPLTMLFADPHSGGAQINIAHDVLIGSGVHMYVNNHRFNDPRLPIILQEYSPSNSIEVRRGCWIGANTILLPGVTIGENAVVGAGSIVTRSVDPATVVAGNPARLIRHL